MVFPGSWLILACTAFRKVIVKDYLCFIICRDLLTSLFSLNSPSSVFSLATSWSHCPLKQTVSIRARRAELPREPLGNGSLLFFFFHSFGFPPRNQFFYFLMQHLQNQQIPHWLGTISKHYPSIPEETDRSFLHRVCWQCSVHVNQFIYFSQKLLKLGMHSTWLFSMICCCSFLCWLK